MLPMEEKMKDDIMDFREKNDEITKAVFKVCIEEPRESFVKVKSQVEDFRKLLIILQGLPCTKERTLVELSVAHNMCLLLLNQTGHDVITVVKRTLKRVSGCLHGDFSHIVRIDDDVDRLLCDVMNNISDAATMNVLLLLSVICGASMMKQRRHSGASQLLRQVYGITEKKTSTLEEQKKIPALVQEPTLLGKKKYSIDDTTFSTSITMATDLPSYRALVTTLVAGCYAAGESNECLELLRTLKLDDKDILILLVKAQILLDLNHVNDCLDVLEHVRRITTDVGITARVHTLVGQCFSKQGKSHSAIQQYRQALQIDFTQLRSLYLVSVEYQKLERNMEELEALYLLAESLSCDLEEQVRRDPDHMTLDVLDHVTNQTLGGAGVTLPFATHQLAKRCLVAGQYDISVEKYKELLTILKKDIFCQVMDCEGVPSVVDILHELVGALMESEQHQEAVNVCNKCIDSYCLISGDALFSENTSGSLDDLVDSCLTASVSRSSSTKSKSNKKRARSEGSQSAGDSTFVDIALLSEDVVALQLKSEALHHLRRNEESLQCLERLVNCLESALVAQPSALGAQDTSVQPPPQKRTKLDEQAQDSEKHEDQQSNNTISDLLLKAYKQRCQILLLMDRGKDAIHWSRLTVQIKPDCLEMVHAHVQLLLILKRIPEAVNTWLPRRGVEPAQLDSFQISTLIAKKTTALNSELEKKVGYERRRYTELDLKLLTYLQNKKMY